MLATLTAWLSPARRRALYGLLAGIAVITSTLGLADTAWVTGVTGLVMAAFDVAALVLASINAKRILYTRIYAIGAAIIAAFKVLGIVVDGQDVQILDLLAKGVALIPLVLAFARTDPSTPTGEPSAEYADPHNDDPIGA